MLSFPFLRKCVIEVYILQTAHIRFVGRIILVYLSLVIQIIQVH